RGLRHHAGNQWCIPRRKQMTEQNETTRVWERGQPIPPAAATDPSPAVNGGNGAAQPQQAAPQPETQPPPPPPRAEGQVDAEGKWVGTITLRKKVNAHGEKVDTLTLREPTGADIELCGNPMVVGRDGMQFDAPAMGSMLSLLAGVPPSAIKALHPKDWMNGA